jgi:transmembrane sensor
MPASDGEQAESMNADSDMVREIIACQAGEWVAAHQAGGLDAAERRAFHTWLMTSPMHVEEYLSLALLARRLRQAAADPQQPIEAILQRVREETGGVIPMGYAPHGSQAAPRARAPQRRLWAAAAVGLAAIAATLFWLRNEQSTPERYATRHGEMRSWHLADNSTLRLNTDTSVAARYSRSQRLVEIERGEVLFEVAHESARPFRVVAGPASVLAVGTTFSVYRQAGSTLVTVLQGRVRVSTAAAGSTSVSVGAGEQVRMMDGAPPQPPTPADVQRNTAWLHRQMVFNREPLAQVTAEFNRYSPRPIDLESPILATLPITGIFAVDDTETFLGFLRTFDRIAIQATPTRIRVFQAALAGPPDTALKRPRP